MLRLFIIYWACIIMGCDSSKTGSDDVVNLKFQGATLQVPNKYLLPGLPESMVGDGEGMDVDQGVSLKIPLPDIGYAVVSEKGLIGNVIVLLTSASQQILNDGVSNDVSEAWQGIGLYDDRIIKRDDVLGFYRVYPKAGYPKLWNYFKTKPADSILNSKNWIAGCMVGPLEEEAADLSNVTCKSIVFYKSVQMEISYSGVHLFSLDKLLDKLKSQLISWDASP